MQKKISQMLERGAPPLPRLSFFCTLSVLVLLFLFYLLLFEFSFHTDVVLFLCEDVFIL